MERRHRSLILASRPAKRGANGDSAEEIGPTESGARYGLFASFPEGMSELLNALSQRIRAGGEIHENAAVAAVRPLCDRGTGFNLSVGRGGVHTETTFDAVILALPAYRTSRLIKSVDAALAEELGQIEYASSAIVVTGHSLADVADPLRGSGLVVPSAEKRSILSVSYASRKFAGRAPAGKVVLRTFVGGALQPEVLNHKDDELIRIVTDELQSILGVRGKPDFAVVAHHRRSMPQYHIGHLNRVERIERLLDAHPRLALAGNAFTGVGIPDCIHSGERAAERILQVLDPPKRGE